MVRECYVRTESHHGDFGCYPGVEYRDQDDLGAMIKHLKWAAGVVLWGHAPDHKAVAKAMEKWIKKKYPGRAYFIETEKDNGGVQVYDPLDFVKERCVCNKHRSDNGQ